MESIPQVVRQGEELHLLRASNQVLQREVSALKAEVGALKTKQQQVQPPLIRGHYRKRAPLPQPLEAGAVDAEHPRQPRRKRMKFVAAAASVSCAAESAAQPPPEDTVATIGVDAILAKLQTIITGMEQERVARQGDLEPAKAMLRPPAANEGAAGNLSQASDTEVFFPFSISSSS